MSDLLILWLHLLSLAAYFGSAVTLIAVLLPMATQISTPDEQQRFLAQGLKRYNPLSIGTLGVVLMTGAFNLTSYKALLGPQFFTLLGGVLGLKLLLVFLLINISAAVSLGMGHQIVRTELRSETIEPERMTNLIKRMQVFTVVILLLTAWIVWISLNLTRLVRVSG